MAISDTTQTAITALDTASKTAHAFPQTSKYQHRFRTGENTLKVFTDNLRHRSIAFALKMEYPKMNEINRTDLRYNVAIHAIQYLIATNMARLFPKDENADPDRATVDSIVAEVHSLE
ncbi:MAG: hypothetical protein LBE22_03720, partial [Azoarcus sp.]|nr:hypothetical protein [Azoarcus sp.]